MLKVRGYLLIFLLSISMTIYWPIAVLGGFILPERLAYSVATAWGRFALVLIKYVAGVSYRVTGKENIPDKPCVVLSKHQSSLDIFVLLTIFDPQSWVFKRELFRIPFFGWALYATKPIAIDRNAGRKALSMVVAQGIEKLKKGYWVVMYPEGTRTPPGVRGNHKGGGVILAQKAGVAIVPVALNTGLFWAKGKGLQNTGIVDIVVGKPISTFGRVSKEIVNEVEDWIEDKSLEIAVNHRHFMAKNVK